jgi:hypothetical protein
MDHYLQTIFIHLSLFFSIPLPGALLNWLLMGEVGPVVQRDRYARLDGAEAWAAFLFASYLFGHLVFLLGSWLDEFYDWARGYTLSVQIRRLALRGKLMPWPLCFGVWDGQRTGASTHETGLRGKGRGGAGRSGDGTRAGGLHA